MNTNHNQSPEQSVAYSISERMRIGSLSIAMVEAAVRQLEISHANTQVESVWKGFRPSSAPINNIVYADFGNTTPELGVPVEPKKFAEKQPEAGIALTKELIQSHNREFMSDISDVNYISEIAPVEPESTNASPASSGDVARNLASNQTFEDLLENAA